jgi:hypothetical protein
MRIGCPGLSKRAILEYSTRSVKKSSGQDSLKRVRSGPARRRAEANRVGRETTSSMGDFHFGLAGGGVQFLELTAVSSTRREFSGRNFMADAVAQPEASAPPLSEIARVIDTFTAPSKTFIDVKRSASWWLPWLIGVVVTIGLGMVIQQKIGWEKTYQNILKQSPAAQQRIEGLQADQQARAIQVGSNITKYTFWATPVLALIIAVIAAAILMATVNFGFGGTSKFGQMMAVYFYSTLPWAIQGILGIATTWFVDPDSFNLKNFVGTNLGYYMPADWPKTLIALGTGIDIFTIWALIIMTIGCAIVGNIKKGQAAIVVWGWWVVTLILKVVGAMFS